MYFVLFYDTVDNFVDRRQPYREEHLARVRQAHESGTLVMAGALKPADGALLVFRADAASVVERFARADPYVTSGLVKAWRVREWTVVIGGAPAAASGSA
jgi:uncharacterized protein